jgi:hypothetical protein
MSAMAQGGRYPEALIARLSRSTLPLETKDIQEFLLGISDLLKSVELVSRKTDHTNYPAAPLETITGKRRLPGEIP